MEEEVKNQKVIEKYLNKLIIKELRQKYNKPITENQRKDSNQVFITILIKGF